MRETLLGYEKEGNWQTVRKKDIDRECDRKIDREWERGKLTESEKGEIDREWERGKLTESEKQRNSQGVRQGNWQRVRKRETDNFLFENVYFVPLDYLVEVLFIKYRLSNSLIFTN